MLNDNLIINDFENYTIDEYKNDILKYGIDNIWNEIISHCINSEQNKIFSVDNFGELYEIGLAHSDKENKKELGKFYTPEDVSILMSNWFKALRGHNICDVCCGTGNLILAYLNVIGKEKAIDILENKRLFLYDIDDVAINICKYSICLKYGIKYLNNIHIIIGDFLDKKIVLPEDCKVISNPPYFKMTKIEKFYEENNVIKNSKEFYSSIMEKILRQSESSVLITPYSFISGSKFYDLRLEMNKHNGFVVSFDNVPGNIFNGKKHGVFNTNSTNSVRAAITVTKNESQKNGYIISPLIRFKNSERNDLLQAKSLESVLSDTYQIVDNENKLYFKCFPDLQDLYNEWINKSTNTLKDFASKEKTEYQICIVNSCRYFTIAAIKDLDRTGKYILYFKTARERDLAYCTLNSSFCYWYWRLYDGGIMYPLCLLHNIPIFFDEISESDKDLLCKIASEMQENELCYLSYKKNANKLQESIKFPQKYRDKINSVLVKSIYEGKIDFSIIHKNSFF